MSIVKKVDADNLPKGEVLFLCDHYLYLAEVVSSDDCGNFIINEAGTTWELEVKRTRYVEPQDYIKLFEVSK